jgi:hypothetical protein
MGLRDFSVLFLQIQLQKNLEFYTFVGKCIFEIHFSKEDKIIVSK